MNQTQDSFITDYTEQAAHWQELADSAPADIKPEIQKIADRLKASMKYAATPKFKKLFCSKGRS